MKTTYSILLAIALAGLARAQVPDVPLPPLPPEQPAAPAAPAPAPAVVDRKNVGDISLLYSKVTVAADESANDAVSIMGSLDVQGEVRGDAVAVFGNAMINGPVGGDVTVVGGNLELGPKADVGGDVVTVGGSFTRDPASRVRGEIAQTAGNTNIRFNVPLREMLRTTTLRGRPLATGAHTAVLWVLTAVSIASYFLLALLFPNAVKRCGDVLVERPGATVLTTFLTILALPLVFLLLLITVVGIPVAFVVLPLAIFGFTWFGKASLAGLIGRRITGDRLGLAPAVLLGSALIVALYLVPIFGAVIALLLLALGFGCVTTVVLTDMRKPKPATAVAAVAAVPPVLPELPDRPTAPLPDNITVATVAAPPIMPATSLPRAGFWIRMAALFIDVVLIGLLLGISHVPHLIPIGIIIYAALMWRLKGSTIGGMICHLKVVRHDDRPLDWSTGIIRALSCFVSLVFAFLGFIWIAFDREKQAWHDKIAGTIVVHPPRGVSLV